MAFMRHILILILLLGATDAVAAPDCSVVARLVQIQGTTLRLMRTQNRGPLSSDLDLVRSATAQLNPNMIGGALGDTLSGADRAVLERFVDRMAVLGQAVRTSNQAAIIALLGQDDTRWLVSRSGPILDRIDCKSTTQADTRIGARPGPSSGLVKVGPIVGQGSVLGLLALSVVLCGSALIYQLVSRHMERRTQMGARHPVHLRSLVRQHSTAEDEAVPATMLDISCRGIKLRLDAPTAAVGDHIELWVQDQWVRATIRWHTAYCVGLRLDRPISLMQVGQLVALNKASQRPALPVSARESIPVK